MSSIREGMVLLGAKALVGALNKVREKHPQEQLETADQRSVRILAAALANCPVDSGRLRASGRIERETRGRVKLIKVVFGGPDIDYAWQVHWDPESGDRFLLRAVEAEVR